MSELWHADINVTDELVQHCLASQFPTLPLQKIECIGEGWDNKVYLINEQFIFRFPRREIAVELIERENKVLGALIGTIQNLAIPNPIYHGLPSSRYPYPFHGYQMIPGVSGCYANLSQAQRKASLSPLTVFLKQLHTIKANEATQLGAKEQVFSRMNVDRVTTDLTERVHKILTRQIFSINLTEYHHEIDTVLKLKIPTGNHCLIHGDLYSRHLMFQNGTLTGIIDWGDTGINNPAVDLAVIWSFYPTELHAEFLSNYGKIDTQTWQYARFLGLYSSLTTALYAFDMKDVLLLTEAIDSIQRINPFLIK